MNPNEDQPRIIAAHRNKNTLDSDQEDIFERMEKQTKVVPVSHNNMKKKIPEEIQTTPEKDNGMDIENKVNRILRYKDLPEEVVFYITEIFPYAQKLFITGVMQDGHTFNLVATQPMKQLYFCLRSEFGEKESHSKQFLDKAQRQITERLHQAGINKFTGQFEFKTYVFEIQDIPRVSRPFYKVRYPFSKEKDQISPDCEGQTFKYVFGTTYTPLQLFVLNSNIKGPGWVKVEKRFLNENNRWVDGSLCCQIQDPELMQVVNEITKTPSMRVMSISLKAVVPSQVKLKKLFNTNKIEELHIYSISYFFCEDYQIESKPSNYKGMCRTFYLKQFGGPSTKDMHSCESQRQMFAAFYNEIKRLDPDVIVCHDSAKIIDTLVQRMNKVVQKNSERPKLGRLNYSHEFSKSNQTQRIVSSLAGRLLCDTFLHSRDMIKSVDYELQEMAKHIKPQKVFKGMGQEQTLGYLNENKAFQVVRKVKEQAQITFALMNHLQILQITRQLSNICGNIWRRSLDIQRAERNEFLIMHECYKRDLIIPDKFRKDKNQDDQQTDKKKYQGGHVIDPLKGFYKDYILLLDFNSLYPSIIREYNVCFSKIKRPLVPLTNYYKPKKGDKKVKEEHIMKDENNDEKQDYLDVSPPERSQCTKQNWGFLPQLIDKIVERRKKAKKQMKKATPQKAVILDIQQKCYKLVANSIYGCLGFSISRFYSKHLAALITRMGREALLRAKDIVGNTSGVRVIYGDTDSLMIQPQNLQGKTQKQKLFDIKAAAEDLKKNINKQYSNLEIDVDGIFKPLILLMKKKYVARKLNNFDQVIAGKELDLKFSIEHKGIEVVRRDGCELQRQFLKEIIHKLMTSQKSEPHQTYEQIYNYAKSFNDKITNKEFSFKHFLFSKQLSKPPGEYARGETIPHVKVALDRMKAGERVETLVNHTIYYLVCLPKEKSQDSLTKCCFDDRTYQRSQKFFDEKGPLEIDYEYYKRELLQPVGRITQHLEEFSTDRLLEEIGLSDEARKKFKRQMEIEREDGQAVLQGCISHSGEQKGKRFNQLFGQAFCACSNKIIPTQKGKLVLTCQACSRPLLAAIQNKLSLIFKQQISEYYNNNYKCKCGKTYSLNLIGDCCKIKFKTRSNIPFEIHELAYITKDLCMATSRKVSQDVRSKLKSLFLKLQKFLEDSDFQKIVGLNKVLKL